MFVTVYFRRFDWFLLKYTSRSLCFFIYYKFFAFFALYFHTLVVGSSNVKRPMSCSSLSLSFLSFLLFLPSPSFSASPDTLKFALFHRWWLIVREFLFTRPLVGSREFLGRAKGRRNASPGGELEESLSSEPPCRASDGSYCHRWWTHRHARRYRRATTNGYWWLPKNLRTIDIGFWYGYRSSFSRARALHVDSPASISLLYFCLRQNRAIFLLEQRDRPVDKNTELVFGLNHIHAD